MMEFNLSESLRIKLMRYRSFNHTMMITFRGYWQSEEKLIEKVSRIKVKCKFQLKKTACQKNVKQTFFSSSLSR